MRRALKLPALVLALGACVAPTPLAAPYPAPLPPYPDVIHTIHGDSRIEWMDSTIDCDGVPAIGCTTYATRHVQIVKGMSPKQTWITIEHEKYHLKFRDYKISFKTQPEEEALCDRLAEARVFEMEAGR